MDNEDSHGHHHDHGDIHDGPIITTRNIEHNNVNIEIETTYKIKINGRDYFTHAMLGEDGFLTCHAIPYKLFASMPELIIALVDLYPNEFENEGHDHGS